MTAAVVSATPALNDLCLYTPEEVASMLRMGRCVVFDELRDGRLRSVRRGRSRRIPAAAIRDYIALLEREEAERGDAA